MKTISPIYLHAAILFGLLFGQYFVLSAQSGVELKEMPYADFEANVLTPKEQPWVVDFWASWCKPCIYAMPEIKKLEGKWGPRGVRFVSLSWDQKKAAGQQAASALHMNWELVFPPDIRNTPFLDKHFKHKFIPALFVVYPNGKVKKVPLEKLDKTLAKIMG
ncbi:MAG: TlpA family protein disulfide reductase [Bacteroidia bacterium]|nr:TlpA family protein disulfide reductase [Bacteroidia bacterium]